MLPVTIFGGGPAGASAAIAALAEGASVRIVEKSAVPRHKVCGEFFSPETGAELDRLGLWAAFQAANPARIRRMALHFGRRSRFSNLPQTAWGLSRYVFDALLLERARGLGATLDREASGEGATIIATGRRSSRSPRGRRLFGFKAHFTGPASDAVELFFFRGGYVGLTPIESGRTNVCGLGPEDFLRRIDFTYDALLDQCPALKERVRGLRRETQWFSTGPLQYAQNFFSRDSEYPTGDALSFVDPFTGSGLLVAVKTGSLAGRAASRSQAASTYLSLCRESLRQPFSVARVLRSLVESGWAEHLVRFAPGRLLFAMTRPR
jgi:flavin-dependent dehydrogenase